MDSDLDIEGPENQSKHKSKSLVVHESTKLPFHSACPFFLAHENELHAVRQKELLPEGRFTFD